MDQAGYSQKKLLIVAHRVHEALKDNNLTHSFLGGLEMIVLGAPRLTKDVDVEVKRQFFSRNNLKTIKEAFSDTNVFRVLDGTRNDGFRMLCKCSDIDDETNAEWIGVDVLTR